MAYTKQEDSPVIWKASVSQFMFIFLHFKLTFCLKRRHRQHSIGDGNIIKGHWFHSNLNDILGSWWCFAPVVISSCHCNKIPQTWSLKRSHIYCLKVLEIRSLTWSHWANIKVSGGLHSFLDVLANNLFIPFSNIQRLVVPSSIFIACKVPCLIFLL